MATATLKPGQLGGLKIVKAQERPPTINMLIYGDSGLGKTTLAGSAAAVEQMSPVLVLDYEGGTESLRHSYPDVDILRVPDWNQMQAVYDELHRTGGAGYKTVVLDSLTEIQKFSMYQIMADRIEANEDADPDVPGMREWGKNLEQTRKFVRAFRDLPVHTIFTALAKDDKNPRTGKTKTLPSLSGKLAGEVSAFLDIVVYYYMKRITTPERGEVEQRLLLCNSTEANIAKDRTARLPVVMEDPTMAKIFELILGRPEVQVDTDDELTALTATN